MSAASTHEVPFQGSHVGTAAFTSATTVTFRGAGTSTHLLRGTSEGDAVITGLDNSCTGGLANVNSDTLTGQRRHADPDHL